MKKVLSVLLIASSIVGVSIANAGGRHHHDNFGRYLGYTAAAVITVGAASYAANSYYNNNYYNRGYSDRNRYENARREQEAYDRAMRARQYNYYNQPRRVVYYNQYPVIQERVIYIDRPVYRVSEPVYNYYP